VDTGEIFAKFDLIVLHAREGKGGSGLWEKTVFRGWFPLKPAARGKSGALAKNPISFNC